MTHYADIWCCECKGTVKARLTTGKEVYAHRPDLHTNAFWICDTCHNYCGVHKVNKNPLGNIATPELRRARQNIHTILDPLWKELDYNRQALYEYISEKVGWDYHTAKLKTVEEAMAVYWIVHDIAHSDSLDHLKDNGFAYDMDMEFYSGLNE
jgi:hypothetical protein